MTPQRPTDLRAPGAINDLLAFHRSVFGDTRMESEMMSRLNAAAARERLEGAAAKMSAIARSLQAAQSAARSFSDENLSAQGVSAKRQELEQAARTRAAAEVASLRREVEVDSRTVRMWAEQHWPQMPEDAVGLQRLTIAWDRARMQLDAGRSVREVLRTADRDVALALREWGPDWLRAHNATIKPAGLDGADWPEPNTEGLVRSCDQRLAEVSGGLTVGAFEALQSVEVARAGVEPMMRLVDLEVIGANNDPSAMLTAAIESRFAVQHATAGYTDPADLQQFAPPSPSATSALESSIASHLGVGESASTS